MNLKINIVPVDEAEKKFILVICFDDYYISTVQNRIEGHYRDLIAQRELIKLKKLKTLFSYNTPLTKLLYPCDKTISIRLFNENSGKLWKNIELNHIVYYLSGFIDSFRFLLLQSGFDPDEVEGQVISDLSRGCYRMFSN